ncbi:uncharacterized protein [Littorina saxatilis]|uniref:C-type lectin domain-containing protein n=1 Tax=Littorina saxatilis TaxID=31220 RepID=A0AAN9FZ83_9CAEN
MLKMDSLNYLLFAVFVSACGSVYIYYPARSRHADALSKCQRFDMTLLELRNQTELDTWNSLKSSLFALQKETRKEEPWLGLVHDGSQYGNMTNYRWRDSGTVTFLSWTLSNSEPDGLPTQGCVRVRNNRFGTKECSYYGYSTVCQNKLSTNTTVSIPIFQRTYFQQNGKQTYSRYNYEKLGDSPKLWLVAMPVTSGVRDVISCAFLCQGSSSCVADFTPAFGCQVYEKAYLPSIH